MKKNTLTPIDFDPHRTPPRVPLSDPINTRIEEMKKFRSEAEKVNETNSTREGVKQKRSLDGLLNGNFCVMETHNHITPKKFLIENMSFFRENGFTHLFMEHCAEDKDRAKTLKGLDDFYIGNYFHASNPESVYNFSKVVEEAENHGLIVVPLEEDHETYKKYKGGKERMISLNYNTKTVVDRIESEFLTQTGTKPKWMAFFGSAHGFEMNEVPGICEIIPGLQDVVIMDENEYLSNGVTVTDTPTRVILQKEIEIDESSPEDLSKLKASILIVRRKGDSMILSEIMREVPDIESPQKEGGASCSVASNEIEETLNFEFGGKSGLFYPESKQEGTPPLPIIEPLKVPTKSLEKRNASDVSKLLPEDPNKKNKTSL
jgi:hypothetical protein